MIGRYPLSQGYIAEHRRLLLIVSAHALLIKQIPAKNCDRHQAKSFSAACEGGPIFSLYYGTAEVVPFHGDFKLTQYLVCRC
jgi:hypothetical protein